MKLHFVLFLLAWAALAHLAFSRILPPTLGKASGVAGRVTAHITCAILAVVLGLLLPLRWVWGWFRDEDQE